MFRKPGFSYAIIAILLTLLFLTPILTACESDDNTQQTVSPTAKSTNTETSEPTSAEPVYIGAINPWSGPAAISGILADQVIDVVEEQVRESGGILGGREVYVIKEDNQSTVSGSVAAVTKLADDDRVAALVFGGVTASEVVAAGETAEERQILYVGITAAPWLDPLRFSIGGSIHQDDVVQPRIDITSEYLKANTVGFLVQDDAKNRELAGMIRESLQEQGIETVYEGIVPVGTMDMSPYLTKIKYENPDVLIVEANSSEFHLMIAKQIMDLGGWDDIKVVVLPSGEAARKMPGAEGWYMLVAWLPEMQNPGSIEFVNDFQSVLGREPNPNHLYFYTTLWTAIKAIELAGTDTDRVAIAEAARSGNLKWETPLGLARWEPDGYARFDLSFCRIEEGGELNLIDIPE